MHCVVIRPEHRDLNFDSHKRFCTRDFACWAYILDYGESKKRCLNYCRNKSSRKIYYDFVKLELVLKQVFYRTVESYFVKYANFLFDIYIFIQ